MDKDMKKNLKDMEQNYVKDNSPIPVPLASIGQARQRFFTKTDKLITALYMVTDIIEKEEPIRHKLRTLGAEIISDIHNTALARSCLASRVEEIVSLLNIASAMSFISEMNCAILKKEFLELNRSINENKEMKPIWLEEFLITPDILKDTGGTYKGHTRIGVQKGSTLMKALSDKTYLLDGNNQTADTAIKSGNRYNFDILKNKRRSDVLSIIKNNGGSATIKDIKMKINTGISDAPSYGEKTLQRELISMTKDGILNRTGEKRWSRYFLAL